jgi:hypothetical protein
MWQHDRGYDHRETEDCSTVVLSADIGRYAADTPLCDVLSDLFARWELLRVDYLHGFTIFGLDAFIAPYDPMGNLSGVFGLDAIIQEAGTDSFGLDAVIAAAIAEEQGAAFGLDAVILDPEECD